MKFRCNSHIRHGFYVRSKSKGVSLIIVLVMLVIIGLTSASAIRKATSTERVTNNIRMQNLAQQYAEAALRFCEVELGRADNLRVNTLRNANVFNDNGTGNPVAGTNNYPPTGWSNAATWTGTTFAAPSRTTVPATQIEAADSSARTPAFLPQCVAERSMMPGGTRVTTVTARGFSPDYARDNATGNTTNGSVVWLQSFNYF